LKKNPERAPGSEPSAEYFAGMARSSTMRRLGLIVAVLLCAQTAARACSLAKFRPHDAPNASPAAPPPRIERVVVTASHSMHQFCGGPIGGISIRLHAADRGDLRGYGLRFRLIDGTFPYRLPGDVLYIWENRVVHYEFGPLPPYPAWRARFAGAIVGPDGQQGPWFEFDAADDGLYAELYLRGLFWPLALFVLAVHLYVCRRTALRSAA